MTALTIDLQDGFMDDSVIIRVDGDLVLEDDHVSTRLQTGFARSVQCDTADSAVTAEVELPGRGQQTTIGIDPHDTAYLGLSLDATGHIASRVSGSMFGYL